MIKNAVSMTIVLTMMVVLLNSMLVESRNVNLDTAIACRPDILPFVPERFLYYFLLAIFKPFIIIGSDRFVPV